MSILTVKRLSFAMVLLGVALCAQTDQRTELAGYVLNSANGQPVAGALVVLEYYPALPAGGVGSQPVADRRLTDASGRFSFLRGPGAGTHLRAVREGFQDSTYIEGLEDDDDAANAGPHNVRIRMTPLSVIHGQVKNSDGEPIPDVPVQAIRLSIEGGRRKTTDFATAVTDDRGEYRLFHVPGGSYYLRAGGRSQELTSLTGLVRLENSDETYPARYYPSALEQLSATAIRLPAGETYQADFVLEPHAAFRIRGQVKGAADYTQPAIVLLRDGENMASRTQYHLTDGRFEISDVVPGTYVLEARETERGLSLRARADVTVSDRDVQGVTLALAPPAEVRGKVEFSGTNPNARTANHLFVMARSRSSTVPDGVADAAADGLFTLRLFPGTYDIDVRQGGYYVASIQSGDTDVLAEGLMVGPFGATDIKMVMSPGGGAIEGVVEDLPQSPTAGANVLVVRKYGSAIMPQVIMAWQGHFRMEYLTPGEYTVYAWIPPRDVEYYNPEALREISSNAVTVYVRDGETQQVSVKLAPKQEQP